MCLTCPDGADLKFSKERGVGDQIRVMQLMFSCGGFYVVNFEKGSIAIDCFVSPFWNIILLSQKNRGG